jgi:hypothetical protein
MAPESLKERVTYNQRKEKEYSHYKLTLLSFVEYRNTLRRVILSALVCSFGRYFIFFFSPCCNVMNASLFFQQMVTREEPYKDIDLLDVAMRVVGQGLRLQIPPNCPPVFRDLMMQCWKTEPNERPTMQEIYETLEAAFQALEGKDRK